MSQFGFAAVFLAVFTLTAASARGEPAAPDASYSLPLLTIRVYAAHEEDRPRAETITLAATLLARAGIRTSWLACGIARADAECAHPVGALELAMRLIRERTPTRSSTPQAMGSSYIDTARRTGTFATMYLDRVDQLARDTHSSSAVILGRALAHEAAHLLLGTNQHGTSGLMRPLWTRAMLLHDDAAAWTFTADEGTRMRASLAYRVVASQPNATR